MEKNSEDTQPDHNAALQRAMVAAAGHDLKTMLAELVACRCLDAMHRYVHKLYPNLRDDEVASVVEQAVDEFAVKAAAGATILDPGAVLFSTAKWRGLTLIQKRRQETLLDEGEWERVAEEVADTADEVDPERAHQLYEAVYRLIPLVGSPNVQAVVRYVVEAAEQGQSVTHPQIAEALGINPNSVGQQLRRGLGRLRQRMLDTGLVPKEFRFAPALDEEAQPDLEAEEAIDHAD